MTDDDISDICEEFGVEADFVNFVWTTLQVLEEKPNLPPLGAFRPRTKRECALAVVAALEHKQQKTKRQKRQR